MVIKMRKKCLAMIIAGLLIASFCSGCQKSDSKAVAVEEEPSLSQIRSICELATLECYYHNVAKLVKESGSGLLHLGEKDRNLWIEYTGVADIGIDMSKVKLEADGENVTITLPNAKLLSCSVKTIDQDSYVYSDDSWFNKNPITAEDQTAAVNDAQKTMKKTVMKNTALFVQAQERAKTLIENYITQLGDAYGAEYHIIWKYEEEAEDVTDTES